MDYITKPFQAEEVLARVQTHVQLQQQKKQLQQKIAERQRTEKALRQSEQRYRDIVDNANEAIVVVQDGRFRFVNPEGCALIGYRTPELLGQPIEQFFFPDDRAAAMERYQRRMNGEDIPPLSEFRIKDKQGRVKWAQNNSIIIQWDCHATTHPPPSQAGNSDEATSGEGQELDLVGGAGPDAWICQSRWVVGKKQGVKVLKVLLAQRDLFVEHFAPRRPVTLWLFAYKGLINEAQTFAKRHGILWSTREQLDELLELLGLRPLPNLDESS